MSVFDLPRLRFAGTALSRLPSGPAASDVDLATGRVHTLRKGDNFAGNGHFLIDAVITSVDPPAASPDPVVGRAVDFWGHYNEYLGTTANRARIFDVDPASRWSTIVMVGQFGFGRSGRSSDTGYMLTGQVEGFQPPRWHRPGQVLHQFVVDQAGGLTWLPEADRSPAVTALRTLLAAERASGLVVQFVLNHRTRPAPRGEPPGVPFDLDGVIAPWHSHELRTYPAGRLLTSRRAKDTCRPPVNLTLQITPADLLVNLVELLPHGLSLRTAHSGSTVAHLPAGVTGIVSAALTGPPERADAEPLEVVDASGAVVLAEEVVNVQVDDACVILEHPRGPEDADHDVEVTVRSFVRGVPAAVSRVEVRQCANPRATQGRHPVVALDGEPSCVLSTDASGLGTFTLRGLRAGTARLSLCADGEAAPQGHDDERHFPGAMTVRVLPDDWRLDGIPLEKVDFSLIHREVFAPYEELYPFMREEVFSLADRFKVETYAMLIWQMCDPRNKDRTYYMPPSRDLTAPKARLLLKYLRRQQTPRDVLVVTPGGHDGRPVLATRDALVRALRCGAAVELAVMLQYLYAAYSVPTYGTGVELVRRGEWTSAQLAMACGDGGKTADGGVRGTLLGIAREEMVHFLMVNNILTAVGEPFHVPRIDFGTINAELPVPLDFCLEGLSVGSAERFARIEEPAGASGEVRLGNLTGAAARPGYGSLSELYADIRDGLTRLPDLFVAAGESGGGEHHLFLRRSIDREHPDYQMEVDDLPSALFAIDVITEQGEGGVLTAEDPGEESHHAAFLRLSSLLAADLSWRPSYPVLRNPSLDPGDHAKDAITDPVAREVAMLFNDAYFLMLQLMVQHFYGRPGGSLRRSPLMNHAIDVMTAMMRPLAELLVTLPAGRAGRTAGPTFELDLLPGYLAQPGVAARTLAARFQRLATRAAACSLVPRRVAEQSAFLSAYFREERA
ncbi:VioB - polyketide synthase [Spongiactinospora rosea]|uniref:VioB-polyketide synthase n=1 Tax=Spongiactinospora rosea TaxID=2248750 RepID=A0A366LPR7_9ACTN|nr:ferritin-like domain-containing protein [Spongiactinospora rosea]RBQ15304.1 VioB - polyketide synthase [Spongiactinospora rosea]